MFKNMIFLSYIPNIIVGIIILFDKKSMESIKKELTKKQKLLLICSFLIPMAYIIIIAINVWIALPYKLKMIKLKTKLWYINNIKCKFSKLNRKINRKIKEQIIEVKVNINLKQNLLNYINYIGMHVILPTTGKYKYRVEKFTPIPVIVKNNKIAVIYECCSSCDDIHMKEFNSINDAIRFIKKIKYFDIYVCNSCIDEFYNELSNSKISNEEVFAF